MQRARRRPMTSAGAPDTEGLPIPGGWRPCLRRRAFLYPEAGGPAFGGGPSYTRRPEALPSAEGLPILEGSLTPYHRIG